MIKIVCNDGSAIYADRLTKNKIDGRVWYASLPDGRSRTWPAVLPWTDIESILRKCAREFGGWGATYKRTRGEWVLIERAKREGMTR